MKKLLYISIAALMFSACADSSDAGTKANADDAKAAGDQSTATTGTEKGTPDDTANTKYIKVGDQQVATVDLSACGDSKMKGKATFVEANGKVTMTARMTGANQGVHAFHIHEKGDCSAADGSSAGGHWNPTGEDHGKWGKAPFHRGDIGNFEADKNGDGKITMVTDLWCVGCDDEMKNVVGKSIIVHAGEDDCTSQPSGAAGPRIACGVISMQK